MMNEGCKIIEMLDTCKVGKWYRKFAKFRCQYCGIEFEAVYLKNGYRKSCGCKYSNETHGGSSTLLYDVWKGMKQRCNNKNDKDYSNYGDRGITVDNDWVNDFSVFRDWAIINGYKTGLQLDRRNNNSNYNSSNCRFVTPAVNTQNRRVNKLSAITVREIRFLGENKDIHVDDLAQMYNVHRRTIYKVLAKTRWKNI